MALKQYTSDELKKMRSETDWQRVDAMTDAEITHAALDDADNSPLTDSKLARLRPAKVRGPQKAPVKVQVSIRLNREVVDYFKSQGPGWQTKINRTLSDYVKAQPP